ncbi:MAG: tRNA pseudouridine(13) synthase TruD, partial [Anaerolineae bacterium]|nr:tRNA pseudouridine(13) synthase TruD [Anaerolineae bacterium]
MPYLTTAIPGIGGQLKSEPGDFFVEEIPLYLPTGQGQHVYITIEKTGLSTYTAIKMIAHALDIPAQAIGHAGLKDAQAVTRQMLSLDGVAPQAVEQLGWPNLKLLQITPHRNKLKIGHLAGNRFVIRVRGVEPEALPTVQQVLGVLAEQGVPNFFGEQRFGNRTNNHILGKLIVQQNAPEFVAEFLGRPQPTETPPIQAARALVDAGRWVEALAQWPGQLADERRVLAAIVRAEGQLEVALKVLDKKLKNFLVSALQGWYFNELLTQRLGRLGHLEDGDVAYLHLNGAAFVVESAAAEQPRADRFEISPSGPLFGPKLLQA